MKAYHYIFLFSLIFIIKEIDGSDGMISCAWGSHKVKRNAAEDYGHLNDSLTKDSINEKNVKFFLYNQDFPYPYQIFLGDENRLGSGNFDVKKLTKIMIHGYKSSEKSSSSVLIRNAFLKAGDYNVIVVDWSRVQRWGVNHAFMIPYPQVAKKVVNVAEYVKRMIEFLANFGMDVKTTTLVGHSLGAHVAGIASHKLENKINRVIGLDPAKPAFTNKNPGERISKEDAKIVEIIHSEMQECGLNNQLGHYDFYPNSGQLQPGCNAYKCSHARSYRYFAESLTTTTGFHARRCADWEEMQQGNCNGEIALMGGVERTPTQEGIYYVKTNDKEPFALGKQ